MPQVGFELVTVECAVSSDAKPTRHQEPSQYELFTVIHW
jgi:hypothetical protein